VNYDPGRTPVHGENFLERWAERTVAWMEPLADRSGVPLSTLVEAVSARLKEDHGREELSKIDVEGIVLDAVERLRRK
jgi:hypothetical protein